MSAFDIAILATGLIAIALLAGGVRRKRPRHDAKTGPEYVWLAIVGKREIGFDRVFAEEAEEKNDNAPEAESTEGTYTGAYVLLKAGLRMELAMTKLDFTERRFYPSGPRVEERITYSTEAFRQRRIKVGSLEEFGRYVPYRAGFLRTMRLSVHPDDEDKAVQVLEDAGLTVERPPGHPGWHKPRELH